MKLQTWEDQENGEVLVLRLMEIGTKVYVVAVDEYGKAGNGRYICAITQDGLLERCKNCAVEGIQTDSCSKIYTTENVP